MSFHNHDSEDFHKKFGKKAEPSKPAATQSGKTLAEIFEKANVGVIWRMSQTMTKEDFVFGVLEQFEVKERMP